MSNYYLEYAVKDGGICVTQTYDDLKSAEYNLNYYSKKYPQYDWKLVYGDMGQVGVKDPTLNTIATAKNGVVISTNNVTIIIVVVIVIVIVGLVLFSGHKK